MISSAALPNVAFRKPPSVGPARSASCSVARADQPGCRNQRERRGDEHPHRTAAAATRSHQLTGAAMSRTFSQLEVRASRT